MTRKSLLESKLSSYVIKFMHLKQSVIKLIWRCYTNAVTVNLLSNVLCVCDHILLRSRLSDTMLHSDFTMSFMWTVCKWYISKIKCKRKPLAHHRKKKRKHQKQKTEMRIINFIRVSVFIRSMWCHVQIYSQYLLYICINVRELVYNISRAIMLLLVCSLFLWL